MQGLWADQAGWVMGSLDIESAMRAGMLRMVMVNVCTGLREALIAERAFDLGWQRGYESNHYTPRSNPAAEAECRLRLRARRGK